MSCLDYHWRPPVKGRSDLDGWAVRRIFGQLVVSGVDMKLRRKVTAPILWWSDGRIGVGRHAQEHIFRLRDPAPNPYPDCPAGEFIFRPPLTPEGGIFWDYSPE